MRKNINIDYRKSFTKLKNKMGLPKYRGVFIERLRYDMDTNTLEVQCSECKKWYALAKLNGDEWIDIHNESEIPVTIFKEVNSICRNCGGKNPDEYTYDYTKILGKATKE